MYILGINAYHPDASVALLKNGELLWAAEEERFNRIKHASGFPKKALQRCLEETKTSPADIDVVAISKDPRVNLFRKIGFVLKYYPAGGLIFNRLKAFQKSSTFKEDFFDAVKDSSTSLKVQFTNVEHHHAHMASGFYVSPFDRAAILSLDGMGDFSSAMWGVGEGNQFRVINQVFFPHSAGFLYTAATQFLGFLSFGDEYKVMGLAAYGKPVYLDIFRRMVFLEPDGRFNLNLAYFLHHKGQAKVRWEGGKPEQDILYSKKWVDVLGQPRESRDPVTERDQNIAASLQAILEEIYFHILNCLHEKTKEKNLCLAGGCAYNSVANGKIKKNTPFENIYIQPAAGDAGTAIGAAAFVYHAIHNQPRKFVMNHALFGSNATQDQIKKAVETKGLSGEKLEEKALIDRTVEMLAKGKIVGWYQGKMEFGPRALGNRSILADPRRTDMKDTLNRRIKHRESFRPFAPAVPEEKAQDYFEMDCASSPFMLKVFPVRPEKSSLIPAITHADGSARVQTVSKETHPLFWELLMNFGKRTGVYVLLNTSFNENEPIVCTPQEAVECFIKTKMDALVIGSYYIPKQK